MEIYGYLYCHISKIDGKKYWGQTKRLPKVRWGKKGNNYGGAFGDAILREGWDSFRHEIVSVAYSKEQLDNAEKYWIKATQSCNPMYGYNRHEGGDNALFAGISKVTPKTKEEKRQISLFRAEKKFAMLLLKENNPKFIFSPEYLEKRYKTVLKIKNMRSLLGIDGNDPFRELSWGKSSEEMRDTIDLWKKLFSATEQDWSKEFHPPVDGVGVGGTCYWI